MLSVPAEELDKLDPLLKSYLDFLESRFLLAISKGIENPAIFLLDLDDEQADRLARMAFDDDQVDLAKAAQISNCRFRVCTWYMSPSQAADRLPEEWNHIGEQLRNWELPEAYPVIVVSSGIVAIAGCPVPTALQAGRFLDDEL